MTLSDGEKLILFMLSEIHERLNITEGDAKFIKSAIINDQLWAIKERFIGIYSGKNDTPEIVREVRRILVMWSNLEYSYSLFSQDEKEMLKSETARSDVKFRGFDGNYECEYMNIASFLIDDMGNFEKFKGRDINSHAPSMDSYRRMYDVYEPMLMQLPGGKLDVSQVIDVMKARIHPDRR